MEARETPLVFECQGEQLIGILHQPKEAASLGVLVVVGGPQYRVGSHRQFVLLARYLADAGLPVLRFDYRSMGDSEGEEVDFEGINEDISAAIEILFREVEGVNRVVIWGLCDAASAALLYAHTDRRVAGLVLLNPWVRTATGEARAYLRHYYLQRLLAATFWKKLLAGQWRPGASTKDFLDKVKKSRMAVKEPDLTQAIGSGEPFPILMADGLASYDGRVLFILSGNNDYVADEFRDLVADSRRWRQLLASKSVELLNFPEANHTFSRSDWRDKVAEWTREWVMSL